MKNTSNDAAAPSLDDASLLARTVVAADVTTSMSRNVEGVIAVVYQRMPPDLRAETICSSRSVPSSYILVLLPKRIAVCNFQGCYMLLTHKKNCNFAKRWHEFYRRLRVCGAYLFKYHYLSQCFC